MTHLIYDKDIRPAISKLVRDGQITRIAAPYWSEHAIQALGIRKKKLDGSLHILCDLFAATTDPLVIKELLERGAQVRINDELHAKVYFNEHEAIIGSANVSRAAFFMHEDIRQFEMCIHSHRPLQIFKFKLRARVRRPLSLEI